MVEFAESYPFSSHSAYLGPEPEGLADVDPVLRHFGAAKGAARERFCEFVAAGIGLDHPSEFESPAESGVLGSEEFVGDTMHRIGRVARSTKRKLKKGYRPFDAETSVASVEAVFALSIDEFRGRMKTARAVMAKEVLILAGVEAGASLSELSAVIDLDTSTVSRRNEAAKGKAALDAKTAFAKNRVAKEYRASIADLQD